MGILYVAGLVVALFVGANVGGSNTGVAFGPAVGSDALTKRSAAALMTAFALVGGWVVGRNVVRTLGTDLLSGEPLGTGTALAVLVLVGGATGVANYAGVPTSTSMTAVGVLGGFGLANGSLAGDVVVDIATWSMLSGAVAFWTSAVVGRYWYARLAAWLPLERSDGRLLTVRQWGPVPYPALGPGTDLGELSGAATVVAVACFMAFGAGANNVANVVAPLVGAGILHIDRGVGLAGVAIGIGAFTVGRRTLETVSNDLTDLPLPAGLFVAVVSASLSVTLSKFGMPASFVVIATMSIVGLGWGRAARTNSGHEPVGDGGADGLYDPSRTARVLSIQLVVPPLAGAVAYLVFAHLLGT